VTLIDDAQDEEAGTPELYSELANIVLAKALEIYGQFAFKEELELAFTKLKNEWFDAETYLMEIMKRDFGAE